MSIIEASTFFEKLLSDTENKREIKIYRNFIAILSSLKKRDLTDDDFTLIENELEILNLKSNPKNKRKYFSKTLNVFKGYLKEKFSLVSENYYIGIGMTLGMCFGVAIGTSFGTSNIAIGLAIGMMIGLFIGRAKDQEAEKQNRVLKI